VVQRTSDATNPVVRTVNVDCTLAPGLAILPLVIRRLQMEMLVQALGAKFHVDSYAVSQGGNASTLAIPHATHYHLAQTLDVKSV
jgi:hypothetical protein